MTENSRGLLLAGVGGMSFLRTLRIIHLLAAGKDTHVPVALELYVGVHVWDAGFQPSAGLPRESFAAEAVAEHRRM